MHAKMHRTRHRDAPRHTLDQADRNALLWIARTGGTRGWGTSPNLTASEKLRGMGLVQQNPVRRGQYHLTSRGLEAYEVLRAGQIPIRRDAGASGRDCGCPHTARDAKKASVPTSSRSLPGPKPQTRWGRPLHAKPGKLARTMKGRDVARSSDEVWNAVERMLAGDLGAAVELDVMIGEGFRSGKTTFARVTERARRHHGRVVPAKTLEGQFAAITPGGTIVLFGVTGRRFTFPSRGYLSRYRIGDMAIRDRFNIAYFGRVKQISPSRVAIASREGSSQPKTHSLTIAQFNHLNWDPQTIEKGLKQNQEWMD